MNILLANDIILRSERGDLKLHVIYNINSVIISRIKHRHIVNFSTETESDIEQISRVARFNTKFNRFIKLRKKNG